MKAVLVSLILFASVHLFAQQQANFIYTEGKTFVIKTFDENLKTGSFEVIDYSHLNGYFNSNNYNISYTNEQIQLSSNSKEVYFKLHGIKNNKFTHSLYRYDLESQEFHTISHISNEMVDWWKVFPELGFILCYGEVSDQISYIDIETGDQLPFEEFDIPFKYINTEVKNEEVFIRGKQGMEYVEFAYNTSTDHITKDTLFHLELEDATLIYQSPFLIESNEEEQLFVLHNMNMINEHRIPYNGGKIHHDRIRRQFIIPGEEHLYSVDYELRVRDSISIQNSSIFLETAEGYIVKGNGNEKGEEQSTFLISKDFRNNSLLTENFASEHLTSVQYTSSTPVEQ